MNKQIVKKTRVSDGETQRQLSVKRLLIAIVVVVCAGMGIKYGWSWWREEKKIAEIEPWFAAYVDVTATPSYAFEQTKNGDISKVVLAFIVAAKTDGCVPSWGSHYTLDEAARDLDLDRRIARLQQLGGEAAVSFGGLLNDELAVSCKDVNKLVQAYETVLDRYNLDTIDFDLENDGLNDGEALERRVQALIQLQQKKRWEGKNLAVWLTLPVSPMGLTEAGLLAVSKMINEGVDLAGINVMTMDFGQSKEQSQSMLEASKLALTESHRQIKAIYELAGIKLSSRSVWRKMGATPMIGQNDVVDEVFGVEDAKGLNEFAIEKGLGRISMWSANRDTACSENYVDVKVVSDSCSGVKSEKFFYSKTLGKGFDGVLAKNASLKTEPERVENELINDDPATSPYQIWIESGAYLQGTKVVWHGNVYEAKWWTKGDLPDNPVVQSWETPWQLVGPVLPGERPVELPKLPADTYPQWQGTEIYQAGDRVLFDEMPFSAKWWTQGDSPAASAANADNSPWKPLSTEEIKAILDSFDQEKRI